MTGRSVSCMEARDIPHMKGLRALMESHACAGRRSVCDAEAYRLPSKYG